MDVVINTGAAEVVITPPVGTSMAGFAHDRVARHVRDDLFAKALVVERGGEYVAIVSCDLSMLQKEMVQQVAAGVEEHLGIPASRVLIAAIHTHTGPETREPPWDIPDIPVNKQWLAGLPKKITEAIAEALARCRPAEMRVGRGQEMQLSFNRLARLKDGTQVFPITHHEGDVVGPAGPIDPEVGVMRFVDSVGSRDDAHIMEVVVADQVVPSVEVYAG